MSSRPRQPLPASLTEVALRVDGRLDRLLAPEIERWAALDPELRGLLTSLRSVLLGGGKRLRAAFCYWAFVGAGGDPADPRVIDAGAALEMLHAAALMHDDVIDGSDRRHGSATVHVRYAGQHREAGWRGDSARFGAGVAILLGDLALAYSDLLLAGAPAPAREVFGEVRLEVNIGQYLDIVGGAQGLGPTDQSQSTPSPEVDAVARARRICRYKTAKYTVERPLHLGAALADPGALPGLAEPLSAFGLPLGEAFQLRDDLLGVFGDPSVTGKPVSDDLREGKPTLLAVMAGARATGPDGRRFAARFGADDLSEAEAADLAHTIEATGARQEVEAAIERLAATASSALAALPILPDARRALEELAAFATGRDH